MRGLRRFGLLVGLVVCVACGGKKDDGAPPPKIRIAFGDCAAVAAPFITGPRPIPFELDTTARAPDEPPPPTPEYVNNTDQTGTGAFASLTGTGDISSGFDDANIYGGL